MERRSPAAAVTAVTTRFESERQIACGQDQTVKIDCLACGGDVFAVDGLRHGYGDRVAVESECLTCGAINQRRLPTPDGETE